MLRCCSCISFIICIALAKICLVVYLGITSSFMLAKKGLLFFSGMMIAAMRISQTLLKLTLDLYRLSSSTRPLLFIRLIILSYNGISSLYLLSVMWLIKRLYNSLFSDFLY